MKLYSQPFLDALNAIFVGLDVTREEDATMRLHAQNSPYKRVYATRAWRDCNKILCVEYELDGEKTWFHYSASGEWW